MEFNYEKRSLDAIRNNSRRVRSEIRKITSIGFGLTREAPILPEKRREVVLKLNGGTIFDDKVLDHEMIQYVDYS